MEEAAQIPKPYFLKVIAPLLGVKKTYVIAITTVLERSNYITKLAEAKNSLGVLYFNVQYLKQVCERCRDTERESSCDHPIPQRAPWKHEDREELMEVLYGEQHKADRLRETRSLQADDEYAAFSRDYLVAFVNAPRFNEPHAHVDTVYIAVDPNFGTEHQTGSRTAVIAFFYEAPFYVVQLI